MCMYIKDIVINELQSDLLKFLIIIHKQYLVIFHLGCKMIIIKNQECRVSFIKV